MCALRRAKDIARADERSVQAGAVQYTVHYAVSYVVTKNVFVVALCDDRP